MPTGVKLTFEDVRDYINGENGNGCKLLSTEYNPKTKLKIQCKCGEIFEVRFDKFKGSPSKKGQKQCPKCSRKKRENRVTFNCEYCGKESSKIKSQFDRYEYHFCSDECKKEWDKNNRVTFNCEYCGKESSVCKSEFDRYEYHFCSNECYRNWNKGENHPCHNPNLTDEERERRRNGEQKQWREDVYERDNYTCQCCGERGGSLNAHHLNSYHWDKEHRTDINNGICLCSKCHDEFHKIYGKRNNTIAQFKEFLFNKYLQSHDLKFLSLIETIDLTTRAF